MTSDYEFGGLVPASVVESLQHIGQWLPRAKAMDDLQACISNADRIPEGHLTDLFTFVATLVRDPNFKISISAMHLLARIVHKAKTSILHHLDSIVTPLIDKLMDSKVSVRQTGNLVFRALLEEVGPQAVLPKLTPHTSHFAWRVREELLNVHITAMLLMPPSSFDWPSTAGFLYSLIDDTKARVRAVALEAFAVLASKVNETRLANILMAIDCSPEDQHRIKQRAAKPSIPSVSDDGLVHHIVDLDSLSANGRSTPGLPRTPSSSYGRLPFGIPTPGSRRGSSEDTPATPASEPLETTPPAIEASSDSIMPAVLRPRRRFSGSSTVSQLQPLCTDAVSTWSFSTSQPYTAITSDSKPPTPPSQTSQTLVLSSTPPLRAVVHPELQTSEEFDLEQLSLVDMVSSSKVRAKANAAVANSTLQSTTSDRVSSAAASNSLQPTSGGRVPDAAAHSSLQHTTSGRIAAAAVITTATPAAKSGKWAPDNREVRVRQSIGSYAMRHQLATGTTVPPTTAAATLQEPWLPPVQGLSVNAMRESLNTVPPVATASVPHSRLGTASSLMQLNSARSSEAENLLQYSSSSPSSPSKADRLRHLKQVQMTRRAQSAGEQSGQEQLLSSSRRLRRSCSAVRPSGATLTSSTAAEIPLPYTRTPSSSISPALSPSRAPQHLNDVSAASFAPSAALRPSTDAGTGTAGQLRSPSKPAGRRTPTPKERLPSAGNATSTAPSELILDDTMPSKNPETDLESALEIILHSNVANRQELDWVKQNEAINTMRLLVRHHSLEIQGCIKDVLEAMLPCVGALRSSTLKNTLCFFQEIFERMGSRMSSEIEDVVPPLIRKAAEVSTAGRENFLTQYADAALSQMVLSCSEVQCTKALLSMLKEKGPSVRLKVAAHLDELLCKSKGAVCRSKALQAQLAKAVATLLEEGSSDTRNHGKRILWSLKRLLLPSNFGALRAQHMDGAVARRVSDVLDSSSGPPDAPTRLAGSYLLVAGQTKCTAYCAEVGVSLPPMRGGLGGEEDDVNRGNTDGVWGRCLPTQSSSSFRQNPSMSGSRKQLGGSRGSRLGSHHSRSVSRSMRGTGEHDTARETIDAHLSHTSLAQIGPGSDWQP